MGVGRPECVAAPRHRSPRRHRLDPRAASYVRILLGDRHPPHARRAALGGLARRARHGGRGRPTPPGRRAGGRARPRSHGRARRLALGRDRDPRAPPHPRREGGRPGPRRRAPHEPPRGRPLRRPGVRVAQGPDPALPGPGRRRRASARRPRLSTGRRRHAPAVGRAPRVGQPLRPGREGPRRRALDPGRPGRHARSTRPPTLASSPSRPPCSSRPSGPTPGSGLWRQAGPASACRAGTARPRWTTRPST